jgi:histidinol phosphatase-like PHP family hydrolase
LFSAIAHPDYAYSFYHSWDEDAIRLADLMIDCSLKYNIPLCFNINGISAKKRLMDYPNNYFWEMVAATKCKVLIEADAHDIKTLTKPVVEKALKLITKWNLTKNIISKMKII